MRNSEISKGLLTGQCILFFSLVFNLILLIAFFSLIEQIFWQISDLGNKLTNRAYFVKIVPFARQTVVSFFAANGFHSLAMQFSCNTAFLVWWKYSVVSIRSPSIPKCLNFCSFTSRSSQFTIQAPRVCCHIDFTYTIPNNFTFFWLYFLMAISSLAIVSVYITTSWILSQ